MGTRIRSAWTSVAALFPAIFILAWTLQFDLPVQTLPPTAEPCWGRIPARLVQALQPWGLNLTRNHFILHRNPWHLSCYSPRLEINHGLHSQTSTRGGGGGGGCLLKSSGQTYRWAMILFFPPPIILVIHLLTRSEQEEEGHESLKGIGHAPVGATDTSQTVFFIVMLHSHHQGD